MQIQENLFDGIEDVKRYNAIRDDFEEIWYDQLGKKRAPEGYLQNTSQYMKHVREILKDEIADSLQIPSTHLCITFSGYRKRTRF